MKLLVGSLFLFGVVHFLFFLFIPVDGWVALALGLTGFFLAGLVLFEGGGFFG